MRIKIFATEAIYIYISDEKRPNSTSPSNIFDKRNKWQRGVPDWEQKQL